MSHTDYTRVQTPLAETMIQPDTTLAMSLKAFVLVLVAVGTALLSLGTGYYALASTDKDLAERCNTNAEKLRGVATKEDLRTLRLDVREDLLNAVWYCEQLGGTMRCRPSLKGDR